MLLNIFLLKRDFSKGDEPRGTYDETHGFIVAAQNEQQARDFAALYRTIAHDHRIRDEASEVWYDSTTTCTNIGIASSELVASVILEDHQAG